MEMAGADVLACRSLCVPPVRAALMAGTGNGIDKRSQARPKETLRRDATAPAQLRLRTAEAADAELLVMMFDELNAHQGEATGRVSAEVVRRDGFGPRPEFQTVIAMLADQPVGYILYHDTWSTEEGGPGFYIYDLFVREAARGQGAGSALIAEVVRRAKAEGRGFVWWCAKEWNTGARRLYASLGAVEEPIRSYAVSGEAFDRLAADAEALEAKS